MNVLTRRDFVRGGLTAGIGIGLAPELLGSAIAQQAAATASAAGTDPYALVDPELRAAVKQFPFPTQPFTSEVLAAARSLPAMPPLPAPAPQPFERHIPGPAGAPDLRLVIVDPAPGTKGRPAFLHMHGGGFVSGTAGQFNPVLQAVAQNCGCLVVSVDYRLAPETHFPGSLEDNYAALRWLYKNSDELGVDRKRIAIGGESAGGTHATLLAMAARGRREIPILFQLLIYPALDDRTGSTRQPSPYIGQFIWNAGSNRFGWTSFLGVPAGSPTVPAGAVPARVENLAGLPPAFIGVGALDLFVDEDVEYARRLIDAGVPTELHVVPGAYHGFDVFVPDAAVSKRFTESWMVALRRAFASG
ncbi:MAG: alpha/beta hydrolase [Candidatus Acidiferrales bacterium]